MVGTLEIVFTIVYVYSEGYYLQNASCQGCVPVKLQNVNAADLKVATIKEIIKNDKNRRIQ